MAFMLKRKVLKPKSFQEKGCVLVSYELPMLKHCYILCESYQNQNQNQNQSQFQQIELMEFFIKESEKMAEEITGNPQSYLIAFSGNKVRKRPNFHIHLFIIEKRWQKAMVYSILAGKNWGQVMYELFKPNK